MEKELITVTLTAAHWDALLRVLSHAPFNLVTQITPAVTDLQKQTGPQMEQIAKRYEEAKKASAPANDEATENIPVDAPSAE